MQVQAKPKNHTMILINCKDIDYSMCSGVVLYCSCGWRYDGLTACIERVHAPQTYVEEHYDRTS